MKPERVTHVLSKLMKSRHRDNGNNDSDASSDVSLSQRSRPSWRLPALLPNIAHNDITRLNQQAQDYQIAHGGLLKAINGEASTHFATGRTIGLSLHPSPFPKHLFEEACEIQAIFQDLYVRIANDPEWIEEALKPVIESDPLTNVLWSVFQSVRESSISSATRLSAGIFRSDYMLYYDPSQGLQLKQVEMNTISCAGAVHGQRVANMHQYLQRTGAYQLSEPEPPAEQHLHQKWELPSCETLTGICDMLEGAHYAYLRLYDAPGSDRAKTCVLMIVQPRNFNIADERPIEYGLWSKDPPVPCFRVEWGEQMLDRTMLTSAGTLLFRPANSHALYVVSVAYLRAGFEPHEYEGTNKGSGYDARVQLERSNAIVCPDILMHLTGLKKVQQALCVPGVLERFISSESAERLRRTFMPMIPLDGSVQGQEGKRLATNPETARCYVLKPCRDGGGHNVYGEQIPSFLEQLPENKWAEFVLMELIEPVVSVNVLISTQGVWMGDVVAELGIWGSCIWQKGGKEVEVLANQQLGWSVRSKNPAVDEMSVVKGYGCFDSIALTDQETKDIK